MNNHKRLLLWALVICSPMIAIDQSKKNIDATKKNNSVKRKAERSRHEKERHTAPYHHRGSYHYGPQTARDRLHWHENQHDLDQAFKLNTITQPEEPTHQGRGAIHKKRLADHQQHHRKPNGQRKHHPRHKQMSDPNAITR